MKGLPIRSLLIASAAMALCSVTATPAGAQAAKAQVVQAISAKDKQQGAEAHPQLVAEFGGAMTGAHADYVVKVGQDIAVKSGLSNAKGDFTVTLLNSPVNNAFAIPGGYIYVTRTLVGLMNNEAELAGVLGHEVGHVAAQHSRKRQSAATRNAIIGILGQILAPQILGSGAAGQLGQRLFAQGSQMLTLSYSRGQETESDNLGIAYLKSAGYDPRAMSTVLTSLANQNALEAQLMGSTTRVPAWASTHPDPASRVRAAAARAGANATGITNRDQFLKSIDGIMYGDDPKQGVVNGRDFTHPEMKFAFQAPAGFYMMNGTRAVSISGQSGKGQLTGAVYNGDLDAYIRTAFAGLTEQGQAQITPQSIEKTTVNGIPAAYGSATVQQQDGALELVIFAYEFSKTSALHFMTVTQAGASNTFSPMFSSMRRISDADAAKVKARKVVVTTVKAGETIQTMASRMAYTDAALNRFLVLNGLNASSQLTAGQKVKLITY